MPPHSIHSDDGTELEVKEGLVLDRDGQPLTPEPAPERTGPRFKVYTFSGSGTGILLPIALFIAILAIGIFIVAGLGAFFLLAPLLVILRLLFSRRR